MLNLDTHIFLHALAGSLTPKEQKLLGNDSWSLASICLWEIFKLSQLRRIELDTHHPDFAICLSQVHIWPLDLAVYRALDRLDFKNDPADEIIAATSIAHNVPLVTRDSHIRRSKIVPFAM